MKSLSIIQAPSNLGLKEPSPGIEPGVKFLPDALLNAGFGKKLNVPDVLHIQPFPYSMQIDEETNVRNANAIACYSNMLSTAVRHKLEENSFQIVLGGDCSILIELLWAYARQEAMDYFFIDGHTDFMLPEQSHTRGAAGMDLAFITGRGHPKLSNIDKLSPYIKEENVFCFGNREYTDWYVDLIKQSNIHYYDLITLRQTGIKKITNDFLLMIKHKKLDGFWVHLDVDVLNDGIMPCVDSRTQGGLSYDELKETLQPLLSSDHAAGIDITILDPTLDKEYKFVSGFSDQMVEILHMLKM